MALTKDDLKQLGNLLDQKLDQKLQPIQDEILYIKQEISDIKLRITHIERRLDLLFEMETEDVQASYGEIESVKKRVVKLERKVATLER
jgi:predicted  nucleic acid-binding Zn-ribbon protein